MLGTSRLITQNNGAVCYDADFDPYGGEHAYTNTCPQNYRFEGKERDSETGNDDFGARSYSSRFGRWLSADWSNVPVPVPYANLTNPQTLNLYSMVIDDPESFADLDGHTSTSEYQLGNSGGGWDPTFAGSMTDDSGLTQMEFDILKSAEIAEYQQQQQAKQQPGQTPRSQVQKPHSQLA
jgi:RHS repeat-associated protein